MGRKDSDWIPAQPLIDYITDHHGGPAGVPGTGVRGQGERDAKEVVHRNRDEELRLRRLEDALLRGRARGVVNLFDADRLCCDELGVHPAVVWGGNWYDFGAETTEADHRWMDRFLGTDTIETGAAA